MVWYVNNRALSYEGFKLDRSPAVKLSCHFAADRIRDVYARHDIWQLPRHVRTLDTRCVTLPGAPGRILMRRTSYKRYKRQRAAH